MKRTNPAFFKTCFQDGGEVRPGVAILGGDQREGNNMTTIFGEDDLFCAQPARISLTNCRVLVKLGRDDRIKSP